MAQLWQMQKLKQNLTVVIVNRAFSSWYPSAICKPISTDGASGTSLGARLVPCPNVGQASTNRDLRLYPGVCFSCIVTNLHLSVI